MRWTIGGACPGAPLRQRRTCEPVTESHSEERQSKSKSMNEYSKKGRNQRKEKSDIRIRR